MKKLLTIAMVGLALCPARAQLFGPESIGGALWGGLIGGAVGGGRHHFSGDGAAIGAGVGLLAGALIGESRRNTFCSPEYRGYGSPVAVSFGYGYGSSCGYSVAGFYQPDAYFAPSYQYRPTRANYAVNGMVLGAASGALIGAGSHDAGAGAAIGAAAGLVLGGVAEHAARTEERAVVAGAQPAVAATSAANHGAQPATPNPTITSKPCATSTYYWTPRPQIADAPRVPDAPTF